LLYEFGVHELKLEVNENELKSKLIHEVLLTRFDTF